MKDNTIWVNLDDIELWERNPNEGDIGAIVESIKDNGFNDTCHYWNGVVKAGNHSVISLRQLRKNGWHPDQCGLESTCLDVCVDGWYISMIDISHMSDAQSNALGLALNGTQRKGMDDPVKLAELLQEIHNDETVSLKATSFSEEDLDELLRDIGKIEVVEDPGAQIDRTAELQEKWQVQRGDIWEIHSSSGDGFHKIMCGDSTCHEDVELLTGGVKADLVLTDPPYGEIQSEWDKQAVWWTILDNVTHKNSYLAFTTSMKYFLIVCKELEDVGWRFRWDAVWNKPCNFPTGKIPARSHENIMVYVKKDSVVADLFFDSYAAGEDGEPWFMTNNSRPYGANRKETTYSLKSQGSHQGRADGRRWVTTSWYETKGNIRQLSGVNATTKPVRIFEKLVLALCPHDGNVYDPFLGSGTTIVACEQTGRIGFGMELMPEYVSVCLERLSDMGLIPRRQ